MEARAGLAMRAVAWEPMRVGRWRATGLSSRAG